MATNKNHNKSPVFKMGQLWHTIDDNHTIEEDDTEEEEDVTKANETMKLRREDMSLFGICPAWDQFYLVVCEYCKQVIKPQALERHIELRHSYHKHISNNQINNSLKLRTDSTNTTTIMPSIRKSSSTTTNAAITENGSDIKSELTNEEIKVKLINKLFKTDVKPIVSLSPIDIKPIVDKSVVFVDNSVDNNCLKNNELFETNVINIKTNSQLINILSPNVSTTSDPLIPEPTGPGPGFATVVSADSDSVTISVPEISLNNKLETNTKEMDPQIVVKPVPKKKSYKKSANPRKLLPCKDRLYDPNKHCGVSVADSDKPCTRSLTCKTHSLTLRRAVQGRIKNFDELLTEHREAKEAALRAQGIEVKPTKKAIQRQQQQLRASQQQQFKEQNQLLSDKNNLQTITRLVFSDSHPIISNSTTNSNTNSLLTFASPLCPSIENVRTRETQQLFHKSQHRLNQIEVGADGSMHMCCHPRPAAICNFNIRTYNLGSRLLSRSNDLTLAALRTAFNNQQFVSKLTNNQKCSSTQSMNSLKSPLRNTNQLFSTNKKLCTSLDSFDSSSDTVADPYSFADAVITTNNNNYTYVKPKTTIAKSASNPSKKKKKSDTNCSTNNSSLLTNGQLFHTSDTTKSVGNNTKKKTVVKRNANNSCVSTTIPLTNSCVVNNSNNLINLSLNTLNTNCEQLINPSTSLINEVPIPHRSLNDFLSNSIDSSKSDNGSILLNGSLLSCKRSTFSALNKPTNPDIKDSINKSIFSVNNNKLSINNLSPALTSSLSSTLSVTPSLRPIIQKQTLPSSSVNTTLSQSQNMSQISQNTNHTIFIKSAKQSLQNQIKTTISSPKLFSKSEDFTT